MKCRPIIQRISTGDGTQLILGLKTNAYSLVPNLTQDIGLTEDSFERGWVFYREAQICYFYVHFDAKNS